MDTGFVYLVRHGETASNAIQRYAGRSDEDLLPSGREQMAHLAVALQGTDVGAIWTSGIRRAVESAQILGDALEVPVIVDHRLDELVMGPWEGLAEREVAERFPGEYRIWLTQPDRLLMEGRETLADLAQRVGSAVRAAASNSEPVLLVTHVAPIRVATLQVLQLPLRLYKSVCIANADCVLCDVERGEARRLGASTSIRQELGLQVRTPQYEHRE